ncbi:MAG: FliI/YscN family ATPase [Pseudomonadota bacterium]
MTSVERRVADALADLSFREVWGTVSRIDTGSVRVTGLRGLGRVGDRLYLEADDRGVGEIIAVDDEAVSVMPAVSLSKLKIGARVVLKSGDAARPGDAWLGRVVNADGREFDGAPIPQGATARLLEPVLPPASDRRGLGTRVDTGLAPFDTFLPLCRGQRIGLFAGSGVGKSTLLANLAKGLDADVVVAALIGERSREIREFVENTLGPEGLARSVVVAATCDEPAPTKRRAAHLALTVAEHFRDAGKHVLLLFDSITRYADAHREIALTSGETPSLRAYPPSTFRAIAGLAERAGPGAGAAGDITAVFSVLVAGSDMDEPVADMVRGVLDGHVVMDRTIAERGRFPAIDVRRSVSRSLPGAASAEENALLAEARRYISAYEEAAPMIQSGLYAAGSDPLIDRAIALWPALDGFVGAAFPSAAESFKALAEVLAGGAPD